MKLLRIDSSVRLENSKTRMLSDHFLTEFGKKVDFDLKTRDVGISPAPFPTDEFIKANYTKPDQRTEQMKEVLSTSDTLIDELIEADKVVIGSPMYNFSISASLKSYIDNIVRVGRTFALDENGTMKGLLAGKKVVVITSRGAFSYKSGAALESFDFQQSYLTALLNFVGITDITFVNAEAQDFGKDNVKSTNFEEAKQQLSELATVW